MMTRRVLFLCSRNRLRSPTAERVFGSWPGLEVDSAGLAADATVTLTADQLDWAELVLVMETRHRRLLQARYRDRLKGKRVICLDIPDSYDFMQPELIQLLLKRAGPLLG